MKIFSSYATISLLQLSRTFRKGNFDEDFARVGIATYGYLDNDGIFDFPILKPVMSLWATKLSTRTLKKVKV